MTMGKVLLILQKFASFLCGGVGARRVLDVPSCLSYLRAMCFESYVRHSLTSEAAG
jgi:hypothetical protein